MRQLAVMHYFSFRYILYARVSNNDICAYDCIIISSEEIVSVAVHLYTI